MFLEFFGTKKGGRSLLFYYKHCQNLSHDELHGVLKAVGLDGHEVDAAAQLAGADAAGVHAGADVGVLAHHHLTHDVVDADGHFRSLRGAHFDVEHVGGLHQESL